jgi:tRNA 5-methylaminomethyl-2-thiouridine biosynthesis bifunctional protein
MPRLPAPPRIAFEPDGFPNDLDHNDGFYSRSGGLAETETVFLSGCGLPERWQGRPAFTIGELGFGTGLNILATIRLWLDTRHHDGWLHLVTFEAHPMEQADAARALSAWPELAPLAERLLARWPVQAYGVQRLTFEGWRVTLTVHVGSAAEMLPRAILQADAWFLDGFAPSRNPQMWSPALLDDVYRCAAPGCVVATYSAARSVRDGLESAGFTVNRLPGHGHKKHRLQAVKPARHEGHAEANPQSAIVVGGGVAGAVAAFTLRQRGLSVTVIDPDPCGRYKASNNPAALVMPRLDRGDTATARFHKAAFLLAADRLGQLPATCFQRIDVTERPRAERDAPRMADLIADPPLPPRMLSGDQRGHLVHRAGGVVFPHALRNYLLAGLPVIDTAIGSVALEAGGWACRNPHGDAIGVADVCVLACGPQIGALLPGFDLPLEGRAGQISLSDPVHPLDQAELPVAGGAYALQFETWLLYGATFDPWPMEGAPPTTTREGHSRNLEGLRKLSPALAGSIDPHSTWGRTSVRVAMPDRMPLAGQLAPGLMALGALGSRGFSTAWLCAEVIASLLLSEPCPVDEGTLAALAPMRFAQRAAKRQAAD